MDTTEVPSAVELQVSVAVEAARKARRLRPEALCAVAVISRASYYNRLTSGGWRLLELVRVAERLGVPLVTLIEGPGAVEEYLTSESLSACTRLRLVAA